MEEHHDLMFGRDENDYSTEWIKSDLVSNRKTFATSRPFFYVLLFFKTFYVTVFLDVSPVVGQHDVWLMSAGEFIEVFWKGKFPFLYIFLFFFRRVEVPLLIFRKKMVPSASSFFSRKLVEKLRVRFRELLRRCRDL